MRSNKASGRVTANKQSRSKMRAQNMQTTAAGQGGVGDRGAVASVPYYNSNPETYSNPLERWRQYVMMYTTSWEARKIVNIPVDDALRKPFLLKGISDNAAKILNRKFKRMQLIPTLKRSLKLERLLGGCLTFMGIESESDDASKKYIAKNEQAKLRFINSIPISRISRMNWDTDPLSENYMRPDSFFINNQGVHVSRCLIWDGSPLFDPNDFALTNYRANLAGFGNSVLGTLWDDIIMACGTRSAAYQLILTNNAIIAAVSELQDLAGTAPGQKNIKKIQDIVNQLSVYRAAIIDGDKVDIKNSPASFGSVPELLITYLQVLSAASDIPASRFLGQAPGGLSTDDRSGLENYYNTIDAFQHERISPQLLRLCDVVGYADVPNWDQERENLDIEWPPLWNETAKEQAERATITIENVIKLIDAALMGEEDAIEEINARGILSVTLKPEDLAVLQDARDAMGVDVEGAGKEEGTTVNATDQIQRLKNMGDQVTLELIKKVAAKLQVDYLQIPYEQILTGAKHEAEHQDVLSWDNVDDREQVIGIALDHLKEDPEYYKKLAKVENARGAEPSRSLPGYFIEKDDEPESGSKGSWIVRDGNHRICAIDGEALFKTRGDAESVLGRVAKGWAKITNAFLSEEALLALTQQTPTEAQIAAGNYRKGHCTIHGMQVAIENPQGSIRKGLSPDNRVWRVEMPYHYGYIKKTEGADGDHVDVAVGPNLESELVFIVDQLDLATGSFDEHKCFLGCVSMKEAQDLYKAGFSDGLGGKRLGAITPLHVGDFKKWLAGGLTKQPYGMEG